MAIDLNKMRNEDLVKLRDKILRGAAPSPEDKKTVEKINAILMGGLTSSNLGKKKLPAAKK